MVLHSFLSNAVNDAVARLAKAGANDLLLKAQRGDLDAREIITLAYLPLVAKQSNAWNKSGLSEEDRFSAGIDGLTRAIDFYDPERDASFSTYATSAIRNAIKRADDNTGHTIRVSVWAHDLIRRVRRLQSKGLSSAEISRLVRVNQTKIRATEDAIRVSETQSLHSTLSDGPEFCLGDIVADESESPFEEVARRELRKMLVQALERLPAEEREVIQLRYGIGVDNAAIGIEKVARQLGISVFLAQRRTKSAISKLKKLMAVPA